MTEDKDLSVNRLRTYIQDAHLSVLIGAGSSAGYFAELGGVEDALAGIEQSSASIHRGGGRFRPVRLLK